LRADRQHARNHPKIEREKNKVGHGQPGGGAVGNFRALLVPPAVALEQHGGGKQKDGNQVEFPGANQGEHTRQNQKIKGDLEMAADGGEMRRNHFSGDLAGGVHGAKDQFSMLLGARVGVRRIG